MSYLVEEDWLAGQQCGRLNNWTGEMIVSHLYIKISQSCTQLHRQRAEQTIWSSAAARRLELAGSSQSV